MAQWSGPLGPWKSLYNHQTPGKSTVDKNVSTEATTSAEAAQGWRNSLKTGGVGSRRSLKVDGVFHSLEAMIVEASM